LTIFSLPSGSTFFRRRTKAIEPFKDGSFSAITCPSPKYRLALPPWQYRFNAEMPDLGRPGKNNLSVLWLAARSGERQ